MENKEVLPKLRNDISNEELLTLILHHTGLKKEDIVKAFVFGSRLYGTAKEDSGKIPTLY